MFAPRCDIALCYAIIWKIGPNYLRKEESNIFFFVNKAGFIIRKYFSESKPDACCHTVL